MPAPLLPGHTLCQLYVTDRESFRHLRIPKSDSGYHPIRLRTSTRLEIENRYKNWMVPHIKQQCDLMEQSDRTRYAIQNKNGDTLTDNVAPKRSACTGFTHFLRFQLPESTPSPRLYALALQRYQSVLETRKSSICRREIDLNLLDNGEEIVSSLNPHPL